MKKVTIADINYFDIDEMSIAEQESQNLSSDHSALADPGAEIKTANAHKFLTDKLQQKDNCLFLTGAGSSKASGGPLMKDLWDYFTTLFVDSSEFTIKKDDIKYTGENIEEFLTWYETDIAYKRNNGENVEDEEIFKNKIISEIKEKCKVPFSLGKSEHLDLLDSITYLRGKDKPRLKIFTLNYDTLFEKAANAGGYVIIDGFSFNSPRLFNGMNFDLDIVERKVNRVEEKGFLKKVFHLYKLHGSLDWMKDGSYAYKKCDENDEGAGEIIYPGSSKYEQSYDMPYFEMLTRFQSELRKESVIINIIGYAFGDNHINRMLQEAIGNNTSLTINLVGGDTLWKKVDDSIEINNNFLENLIPYIENGRINLFKMRFSGFAKLLSTKNPVMTDEEKLAKAILDFQNSKLGL